MTLNEKLAALRREQGLSQEDLAGRLEVSRQAVSKWETGASAPDLEKLLALSDLFAVSADYLLRDEETVPFPIGPAKMHLPGEGKPRFPACIPRTGAQKGAGALDCGMGHRRAGDAGDCGAVGALHHD